MNPVLKHIIRFVIFVLAQGLIVGQIPFPLGIHPMIYPLFILLLPFEMGLIGVMVIAFFCGLSIDFFMNTFGLHASSAVLIAYLRPELFSLFSPRDGYEGFEEGNIYQMGWRWFIPVFGIFTLVHHLYFFILEYLSFKEIFFVLQKTILSALITLFLAIIIQVLFFKKGKKK